MDAWEDGVEGMREGVEGGFRGIEDGGDGDEGGGDDGDRGGGVEGGCSSSTCIPSSFLVRSSSLSSSMALSVRMGCESALRGACSEWEWEESAWAGGVVISVAASVGLFSDLLLDLCTSWYPSRSVPGSTSRWGGPPVRARALAGRFAFGRPGHRVDG
jgi:hypothetical protein